MSSSDSALAPPCSSRKYKGVRMRKWGKWVSEIRLPHSREKVWLGSYSTPEEAGRAFDAASFSLKGSSASLNFPHNPPRSFSRCLSARCLQATAAMAASLGRTAAGAAMAASSSSTPSSPSSMDVSDPRPNCQCNCLTTQHNIQVLRCEINEGQQTSSSSCSDTPLQCNSATIQHNMQVPRTEINESKQTSPSSCVDGAYTPPSQVSRPQISEPQQTPCSCCFDVSDTPPPPCQCNADQQDIRVSRGQINDFSHSPCQCNWKNNTTNCDLSKTPCSNETLDDCNTLNSSLDPCKTEASQALSSHPTHNHLTSISHELQLEALHFDELQEQFDLMNCDLHQHGLVVTSNPATFVYRFVRD